MLWPMVILVLTQVLFRGSRWPVSACSLSMAYLIEASESEEVCRRVFQMQPAIGGQMSNDLQPGDAPRLQLGLRAAPPPDLQTARG